MAKIRIVGDASGYVELSAQNAAGNNTLELPSGSTKLVGSDNSGNIVVGVVTATSIAGVTTAGITTAYIGAINDGPISGARNRLINADMRIDQRRNGSSVSFSNSSDNTLDRWFCMLQGGATGTLSFQRVGDVPVGFTSSMKATVTVADSTDTQAYIGQFVEGYNWSDMYYGTASAKTVTLSFWVKSSIAGLYCGGITGGGVSGNQVGYVFEYNISSTNTWEYKSVTIPGEKSGTYTFDTTNGTGIRLKFDLGTKGASFTAAPNAWTAGLKYSTTTAGAVRWKETSGATFYLTGVQLEVGTVATPFERRSYGQELALCQRYYYKQTDATDNRFGVSGGGNTTTTRLITQFPVTMRTAPPSLSQTGTASNYKLIVGGVSQNCTAVPVINASSVYSTETIFTSSSLTASAAYVVWSDVANTFLAWSAEL